MSEKNKETRENTIRKICNDASLNSKEKLNEIKEALKKYDKKFVYCAESVLKWEFGINCNSDDTGNLYKKKRYFTAHGITAITVADKLKDEKKEDTPENITEELVKLAKEPKNVVYYYKKIYDDSYIGDIEDKNIACLFFHIVFKEGGKNGREIIRNIFGVEGLYPDKYMRKIAEIVNNLGEKEIIEKFNLIKKVWEDYARKKNDELEEGIINRIKSIEYIKDKDKEKEKEKNGTGKIKKEKEQTKEKIIIKIIAISLSLGLIIFLIYRIFFYSPKK